MEWGNTGKSDQSLYRRKSPPFFVSVLRRSDVNLTLSLTLPFFGATDPVGSVAPDSNFSSAPCSDICH